MLNRLALLNAPTSVPTFSGSVRTGSTLSFAGTADSVQFGASRQALFRKYKIDPASVPVVTTGNALAADKADVLYRLLQAAEQAKVALAVRKQFEGNYSNSSFGCQVLQHNGQWTLGSNFERSRDQTLCGERATMASARDKALSKISPSRFEKDADYRDKTLDGMRYQLIALSGQAYDQGVTPCADCQNWLTENPHIGPDTQLVDLRRDVRTNTLYLNIKTVADLLPFAPQPSLSKRPLDRLPMVSSRKAKLSMSRCQLSASDMRKLIRQAKAASQNNQMAFLSEKPTGVATLFSNGQIFQEQRLDLTARWYADAALSGLKRGIQEDPDTRLQAIALYGDEKVPSPQLVGRLAQITWGSPETLIVVVHNDSIQVKTAEDYMTEIYIADSTIARNTFSDP